MKYLRYLAVVIVLAVSFLALTACQKLASPIEDYNWVLIQYGSPGDMKNALPDTATTAFFDSKEKKVSGSGGCNSYGGSYTVDGLTLAIIGPLPATEMWCGDEKGAQESAFLKALKGADSFEMDHGDLIIHTGDFRMIFKRDNSTEKPITKWGE